MPFAPIVKYTAFINEVSKGGHNLQTAVLKLALTNTAPSAASDTVLAAPPPAAANGYPAGGAVLTTVSAGVVNGVFRLFLQDFVFTATAGGLGPFRWAILFNSSAGNKLIGYYDNITAINMVSAETFTVDFDGANGAITLT